MGTDRAEFSISAPAKVNLTLEVLSDRPDGFHELRSILQSLAFCDTLTFRSDASAHVSFDADSGEFDRRRSLVSKAAELLYHTTGCTKGARISIKKRIPLSSGLGGDSSCALAVLLGLNRLWQLGLSRPDIHNLAASLGSDVPYFLYRGTALVSGKGEIMTPLPGIRPTPVLLIFPKVEVPERKTASLYAALSRSDYTDGSATDALSVRIKNHEGVRAADIVNVFENVAPACYRGIGEYMKRVREAGAGAVHLCGAGPTLFSMAETRLEAEALLKKLSDCGIRCILTETATSSPVE